MAPADDITAATSPALPEHGWTLQRSARGFQSAGRPILSIDRSRRVAAASRDARGRYASYSLTGFDSCLLRAASNGARSKTNRL